ncbi:class I SAM-dependent DNA methyltransferase [Pseudomonas umsongensis]|uniref:site-specific DNA-methyltransferase (adenine-specific) n=1 Tax=Pseudomonas umsongensis TaxID=198618 RepID=A0AAE7A023_9PSED|nr:class I SAM-dependent DNA methyltransferase [Pseudomonas umsongensis]QJC81903.1 class I SAM-dependent DNA methyltransferase [Pseudomonas umsongensis]
MIEQKVEAYIERWGGGMSRGGNERANLQMFITELCTLLDLPQPEPATAKRSDNAYIFERSVTELFADGGKTTRALDLYKRGCFILEGKDTGKQTHSDGWDAAITKALKQAENYARSLPAEEGRPPFIIVADVGKSLALYSEFSLSGGNYVAYPDPRSHKIPLEKLRDAETRELLKRVWLDPKNLDPTRYAGKITRVIADQLAKLAKSLEDSGHPAEQVASFLMRCLFTMFSEDVGLLPDRGFTELLERLKAKPESFCRQLRSLWQTMNTGGFAPALDTDVLQFNGGLFADAQVIELNVDQLNLLAGAAKADWRYVEPAIFGTLLERALNPRERHKLGAHYTPRAYVERLVLPTIIEPLRSEWAEVQAAALTYKQQRKTKEAVAEIRKFHHQLCQTRVLDPACGSGNFLYVTLEHMKRLEGEVLEVLGSIVKSGSFELEGLTVDPHQFLGMEINPRAAKIAEMVLWIGYLQWHFRTYGKVNPPEPVLRDFHNIEHRDALITYDAVELITDESGRPVTRWDGLTYKISPITGESIPDESAQVEQHRYHSPRKAKWPQAEYIVGNPPFIGASTMRRALGDGYVDAVRSTWAEVPESADFVMHWWHIAAEAARAGTAKRFGFITTNSIKQTFNRRVVQAQLEAKNPLSLAFAIPDHPWVDAADGAQVRIAMTVGAAGIQEGRLLQVRDEISGDQDEIQVNLQEQQGRLFADLKIGANVAGASQLKANKKVAVKGFELGNQGFLLDKMQALKLLEAQPGACDVLKPYMNGSQLVDGELKFYVLDFHGLSNEEARQKYPQLYQIIYDRVRDTRTLNRESRTAEKWWLFRRSGQAFRDAVCGLDRYVATTRTAKHRVFQFLNSSVVAESKIVIVAVDADYELGCLSSRLHCCWAMSSGAWLGVGNDSTYNHTDCFETFPFPDTTSEQRKRIGHLAEQIDAHRKHQQAHFPDLTLTGMYNALDALRAGRPLTTKEKTAHQQGLVSILGELHDELDHAVFAAYGWGDLAKKLIGLPGATTPLQDKPEAQAEAEEELLCRLVELNGKRAADEARGQIRWLRPDYQNPTAQAMPEQVEAELETEIEGSTALAARAKKAAWPKGMREQIAAVRSALSIDAMTAEAIAANFKEPKKTSPLIIEALAALEELGMVYQQDDHYRLAS